MSALFLLLGCCSGANALLLPRAPSLVLAAPRAARPAMGAMGADQCAVIELTGTEPILLAKTLRSAWMEAGVKRGLTGTVIIPEEGEGFVQIVAQGDLDRVKAYAKWCGRQLGTTATSVEVVDADSCPAAPLSAKFPVAEMPRGKASAPWAQLLARGLEDVTAAQGKTFSSDEGLM